MAQLQNEINALLLLYTEKMLTRWRHVGGVSMSSSQSQRTAELRIRLKTIRGNVVSLFFFFGGVGGGGEGGGTPPVQPATSPVQRAGGRMHTRGKLTAFANCSRSWRHNHQLIDAYNLYQ